MAMDKEEIRKSYPLPVYNYRVTIGSTTMGFSEVSGLGVHYEPVTYKHGLSFAMGARIIPGVRSPIRVTMKKGVVQGTHFLASWFREEYSNPLTAGQKDILVDLCDGSGTPVVRWKVRGVLPVKLDAPTFSAESNEVAIETMELIAHDIHVEDLA